jgi:hypothetical protein
MFYDDPWNNETHDNFYTWTTGGGDALGPPPVTHLKWTRDQEVVKDVLPLYDVEDVWNKPCSCETKSKIINANPNVCLQVWDYETLFSPTPHTRDKPMIPFHKDYSKYRDQCIYVNDYNAAVRWDRLTGHDPVDHWQNDFFEESAGTGDFWLSAPSFNAEKEVNNDPLDVTGRLVVSGNNIIYIWDIHKERLEFNALTGERIVRP